VNTKAPHPFPARMAPEIALSMVASGGAGRVLDPMCGSGTVLRAALAAGRTAIGFDVDPLAVLMSRVWTGGPLEELESTANSVVSRSLSGAVQPRLEWMDSDRETSEFVSFWFGRDQQHDLRRLAISIEKAEPLHRDALRLALSRTIITKDRGASLARDVSHSRPHRVRESNDFDVMKSFMRGISHIQSALKAAPTGNCSVARGDARSLATVPKSSVSSIVTSPPYLNAIDYLRGHRLALVWLGYQIKELREIRGASIGTERKLDVADMDDAMLEISIKFGMPVNDDKLGGMLRRYLKDLFGMLSECQRVLRVGGEATFVIGNSTIRGIYVDNADLAAIVGKRVGLTEIGRTERELPDNRRYLPPPKMADTHDLRKRMRSEVILRMTKPV
jgi:hypothetical protein